MSPVTFNIEEAVRNRHAQGAKNAKAALCCLPLYDAKLFRVLRTGGRAVISGIVSDEDVPARLQNDPNLWSCC
jgi:hypothetical protein